MRPTRMSVAAIAAQLAIAPVTWRSYVSRGQVPPADGHADPCGCPWWWSTTVEEYAAARPRKGRRGPDATPRKRRASTRPAPDVALVSPQPAERPAPYTATP